MIFERGRNLSQQVVRRGQDLGCVERKLDLLVDLKVVLLHLDAWRRGLLRRRYWAPQRDWSRVFEACDSTTSGCAQGEQCSYRCRCSRHVYLPPEARVERADR